MSKYYKNLEKRIEEIKNSEKREKDFISSQLVLLQNKLDKAEEELTKAIESGTPEEYEKAIKEKADSELALEMYGKRLELINSKKYLKPCETTDIYKATRDYQNQITEDTEKKAAKIFRELDALCTEYKAEIGKGDELLNDWVRNIDTEGVESWIEYNGRIRQYPNARLTWLFNKCLENEVFRNAVGLRWNGSDWIRA